MKKTLTTKIPLLLSLCFLLLHPINAATIKLLSDCTPWPTSCPNDYKLCERCATGTISCFPSPTLSCSSCFSGFQSAILANKGLLFCSTTQGCVNLDKTTGLCQQCANGFYASYEKIGSVYEITCTKTVLTLKQYLNTINGIDTGALSLTDQTPFRSEIVYRYAVEKFGGAYFVNEIRQTTQYARDSMECGGSDHALTIFEKCQCVSSGIYYGARCNSEKSNLSSINTEIQAVLTELQNIYTNKGSSLDYEKTLNTFLTIAEQADGFDQTTLTQFNTVLANFGFLDIGYSTLIAALDSAGGNPKYTLLGSYLGVVSVLCQQLSQSSDATLLTAFTSSSIELPNVKLQAALDLYYTKSIDITLPGLTTNTLSAIYGTKTDLYFQYLKNTLTKQFQDYIMIARNPSSINFMNIDSISSYGCLNIPIDTPSFLISNKAYNAFSTQASGFDIFFFINIFAFNPYAYNDNSINSMVIQLSVFYNTIVPTGTPAYSKLSSFTVTLQQDYLAVLIPKYKSQQYSLNEYATPTCKILNESTSKWDSSEDLGVYNDKTVNCLTHVICFYDLQKALVKGRQFAYQMDVLDESPSSDFFISAQYDYWKFSGFIIPMCLISLFVFLVLVFLFVPGLRSNKIPKRRMQINENMNNNVIPPPRERNYELADNQLTDPRQDTEGGLGVISDRRQSSIIESSSQQISDVITEQVEMNPFMSLHFYSIYHTQEKNYQIQKISILIMNWMFISCFLAIMYKFIPAAYNTLVSSDVTLCVIYTLIASWIANYIWGFFAVKLRRTVGGSSTVFPLYYVVFICLYAFLFFIEIQAAEKFDESAIQKWHVASFFLCIVIDYIFIDVFLVFLYEYLAANAKPFFYQLGFFLRNRGFYQH